MDHMNAVHILQPIDGIDKLSESVRSVPIWHGAITHELEMISSFMSPYELIDVTVIHPLRYHRKSALFQINTNKR